MLTFCSSIAKTSTMTPIFYFMIFRPVLPFTEKKKWAVAIFVNFTKLKGLNYNGLTSASKLSLLWSVIKNKDIKRHFSGTWVSR